MLKNKFTKAAEDIRRRIPRVDDPFWNFYHNTTQSADPTIVIPIAFYKDDVLVASANFRCLSSPVSLTWLTLKMTTDSNPALDWSHIQINHGSKIDKETATKNFVDIDERRKAIADVKSVHDAFNNFTNNLDTLTSAPILTPATIRKRYEDITTTLAYALCQSAYDITWTKGAPTRSLWNKLTGK